MKIVIASLLCATIANADVMSGREQVDAAHFQSKAFGGKAAYRGEHKYIASLQLNGSHICSSGMFQIGFLLTTVDCAWHLGEVIKKKEQRATAAFANPVLKDGQRINIHKIAYCFRNTYYENDIGIIMLVNNYDHSALEFLHLRPAIVGLRQYGPGASVCGWVTDGPLINVEFEDAKFSDNLHCTAIQLHGDKSCQKNIPFGDYKRKLMCGTSYTPKGIPTVEDVGSPVTKIIQYKGEHENFIVGVTIRPHVHGNVTFYRFIRIRLVFDDIQALVEELESKTGAYQPCVRLYYGLKEESNQRQKR